MDLNKIVEESVKDISQKFIEENIDKYLKEKELSCFKPTEIVINNLPKVEIKDKVLHNKFKIVCQMALNKIPIWLIGPAGSGKTALVEIVAETLNLPFYPISVSSQTTASSLIGYMNANGEYVKTHFREAYENGGVFLLDEIDNGNANVLSVLNSSLSNNCCSFPDKIVKRNENFIMIASGNTYGTGANRMYVGRNEIDAATLDRFCFVEIDYDENVERFAINNDGVYDFITCVREAIANLKIRHIVSTRAGIYLNSLLLMGTPFKDACKISVYKNLSSEQIKQIEIKVTLEVINRAKKTKPKPKQQTKDEVERAQTPKEVGIENKQKEFEELFV